MKIAIVTGASSAMGRKMVFLLADRFGGLEEIWVVARRKEALCALKGQVPVKLRVFPMDLTKEEGKEHFSHTLELLHPDVKLLVNAAGTGTSGLAEEIPVSRQTETVRLNCEALVWMTETVLPYMNANSRILQFSSAAAFLPQPGFAVYAASKSFVLSYSRALAGELKKRRIYVTAVCPGPVRTEFFQNGGMGPLPFYKKLFMAKPEKVVKKALKDAMKGKELSIYGMGMNLFFAACRIFPHRLLMRFAEFFTDQKKDR